MNEGKRKEKIKKEEKNQDKKRDQLQNIRDHIT